MELELGNHYETRDTPHQGDGEHFFDKNEGGHAKMECMYRSINLFRIRNYELNINGKIEKTYNLIGEKVVLGDILQETLSNEPSNLHY